MVLIDRKGQARFLEDRILGGMNMLGEMADGISRRHGDRASVLMFFAEDHSEECGFPVSVPAHEPHALAGVDGKANAVEEHLFAV
jgi:hypothetical protein